MKAELIFYLENINLAGLYIPNHSHSCFEIVYYKGGSGVLEINSEKQTYRSNDFAVVFPESKHNENCISETEVICIGFNFSSDNLKLNEGIFCDSPDYSLYSIIKRIKKEYNKHLMFYDLKINLLISEFIIEINRLNNTEESFSKDIKYAYNYINENCYMDIDLKSLAREYGYSYDRFRHIFKEKFCISPNNLIISKRLDNAIKLLTQTHKPISDIALDSGYGNISQFSKIFKEKFGVSPKEFRKNNK